MPDLIFIDTETTGLEPSADIWEFAGIRRRADGISEQLHLFIEHDAVKCELLPEPFRSDHATRFPHLGAVSRMVAAEQILGFVDRPTGEPAPVWVGSAPDFDASRASYLLRDVISRRDEFFEESDWREPWDHQLIGVVPLMLGYLAAKGLPIPAHKSEELSRACGVEPDDFERHTAMGDVLWTQAIFDCVMGADHA